MFAVDPERTAGSSLSFPHPHPRPVGERVRAVSPFQVEGRGEDVAPSPFQGEGRGEGQAIIWHIPSPSGIASPRALGRSLRRRPSILPWAELGLVLLVAPLLWFPTLRPSLAALAVLVLLLSWFLVALVEDRLWPLSPLDPALVVLVLMAAFGAFRSPAPILTLPKVTSLILGLALYRALGFFPRTPRSVLAVAYLLCGLALLFALVGLLGGVQARKVPAVDALWARLPRFLSQLPEAQGGQVNANQVGGMLLYILPLPLALALGPRPLSWGHRLFLGLLALFLGAALILSQSRSAWLGLLGGLLLWLGLRWPWGRWAVLSVFVAGGVAWLLWGGTRLAPWLWPVVADARGLPTAIGSVGLAGRLEIWARTLAAIRASPCFGGGLGAFRLQSATLREGASPFDLGTPHAHNVFLQMAYDTGLPGLAAYLALLGLAGGLCLRAWRRGQGVYRGAGLGGLACLVAYHLYGLTDVVALGAKPGLLFWGLLALIASLS